MIPLSIILGGFLISYLIKVMLTRRAINSLPEAESRVVLVQHLKMLREAGANFDKQQKYLLQNGLTKIAATGIITNLENDQMPDVENLGEVKWQNFIFTFPGNWTVEPAVQLGVFRLFKINLAIRDRNLNGVYFLVPESEEDLTLLRETTIKQFQSFHSRSISTWGSISGVGEEVEGFNKTARSPMKMLIFSSDKIKPPVTIVEMINLDNSVSVNSGIKLIKDSLTLSS